MRCSRDADPDVRVKIAECLGELGAVDPGRLDLSAVAKDTKPIRMYEVSQSLITFVSNPIFCSDFHCEAQIGI